MPPLLPRQGCPPDPGAVAATAELKPGCVGSCRCVCVCLQVEEVDARARRGSRRRTQGLDAASASASGFSTRRGTAGGGDAAALMNGFAAANDAAVTFSLGFAGALAYSNSARHHHFVQHVTVIEPNEVMALPGEELGRRSTGRELGRRPMQSEAFCDAVAASSKATLLAYGF